jgi:protocatechuate 3,4-dioxygenase beta subunit
MSRAFLCFATLLALPLPALNQPPVRDNQAQTVGTASIHGRVVEATTGRGLSRVEVVAEAGGPAPPSALTDGDGRYHLTGIPAGAYIVSASRANYLRSAWGQTRVDGPGKRITLADGQQLNDVNLTLPRGGVITGRIVDEVGDPLPEVFVSAMRYQYIQGSRRLIQSGRSGQTNDIGEYRLYGLPPGQYYVSAVTRDFRGGDPNDRTGYASTFYPGTGNVAEAQRFAIAPGQTMTGMNLTLLPVQTATVSGTVLDANGRPLADARVFVTQRVGTALLGGMGLPTQTDGSFSFPNLTPGDYVVRGNGPAGEVARANITVTGSDVHDVQLVVAKPSTIRGRVVFTSSATAQGPPKPAAIDIGAWREWEIGEPVRSAAKVHDDGSFEISLAAGRVHLRAGSIGPVTTGAVPWRLNRVIVNNLDVADTGLEVPSNSAVENVVVEMTNQVGEVSGRVTDAAGNAVGDCMVIVFAQDPGHWTVQSRHVSIARPADDVYRARLLPGDYYAVAMIDVEPNVWTSPDFLTLAREQATKFSIAVGEKRTFDLRLSPAPVF